MAEPALRGGDVPAGHPRTLVARERTDRRTWMRQVPGKGESALGQLVPSGQVQVRRQERPGTDVGRAHELRDLEDAHRLPGIPRLDVRVAHRRDAGSQVEPD